LDKGLITPVGIDFGGNGCSVGARIDGKVVFLGKKFAFQGAEHFAQTIAERTNCLWPIAIGSATAGTLDIANGIIESSPSVPAWSKGEPGIFAIIQEIMGCSFVGGKMNNDVWVATRGAINQHPELKNGIMLNFGTGVAVKVWINGVVVEIHSEFGHIKFARILPEDMLLPDRMCRCGARDCLEAHAGEDGLLATIQKYQQQNGIVHDEKLSYFRELDLSYKESWAKMTRNELGRIFGQVLGDAYNAYGVLPTLIRGGTMLKMPELAQQHIIGVMRDAAPHFMMDPKYQTPRVAKVGIGFSEPTDAIEGGVLLAEEVIAAL
jgi:predicted NBD/HSP70 family sugar kinase